MFRNADVGAPKTQVSELFDQRITNYGIVVDEEIQLIQTREDQEDDVPAL